jgi:hypothetical protein
VLAIDFPGGARRTARLLLAALVTLSAAALVALGWALLRRRTPAPPVATDDEAPAVGSPAAAALDAVAELDAKYAGRESEVPAEEWARYRMERARLKAALEDALARGDVTS